MKEIGSPAREIGDIFCNCWSLPPNAGDLTCMPIGVIAIVEDRHCEYKIVKIFPNLAGVRRTAADAIFGSPTEFLAVLGLPDTRYFDPWVIKNVVKRRYQLFFINLVVWLSPSKCLFILF